MSSIHKMSIEDIRQQCEPLSNDQLLLIVLNKRLYTEKIVLVAGQELRKRGVSEEEIKGHIRQQTRRTGMITGNIHEDILFWEKVGFFFICVPWLHHRVFRDYRKKNYVLKVHQATYYNLAGAAIFVLLINLLIQHYVSASTGLIIWMASFLLTYAFNQLYFKQRTIRRLEARKAPGEVKSPEI